MKKFLILILVLNQLIFSEKILVSIERIIKEIDESTSCNVENWHNNLPAAAQCYLIKRKPDLEKGINPDSIIEDCKKKNFCNDKFINDFVQKYDNSKKALLHLYARSIIIKKVNIEGTQNINAQGILTLHGVKYLLEKAYKENLLPIDDFKSIECLEVKDIFAQEKGFQTLQLFLIKSTCTAHHNEYILKEIESKYAETKRLADLSGKKELDFILWPKTVKNFPSLALPIAFFKYKNHYFSLSPKATGMHPEDFIFNYINNKISKNLELMNEALFNIGFSIATFHQYFMHKKGSPLKPTIIHGDFHNKNIFYDPAIKQTILIDCEDLIDSYNSNKNGLNEIEYFLTTPDKNNQIIPYLKSSKLWKQYATQPFLEGYISAYPKEHQLNYFNIIATKLNISAPDKKNIENYLIEHMDPLSHVKKTLKTLIDDLNFLQNSLKKIIDFEQNLLSAQHDVAK